MENSILKKLAPELRLKIYAHVFEGAEITITIRKPRHGTDQQPDAEFAYSAHARLAQTCRAVRAESLHVLYREAIIVGGGPGGSNYVWLDDLNKVLEDDLAQEISHVRNVRLPELRSPPAAGGGGAPQQQQQHNDDDTMALLQKYPKLKTCGLCFAAGDARGCARSFESAEGTPIQPSVFRDSPGQVYDKAFRFTTVSNIAPRGLLERMFGIRESCAVLFLQLRVLTWDFEYGLLEPEMRFAPMEGDSVDSYLPSSMAGWFNYSTGVCWLIRSPRPGRFYEWQPRLRIPEGLTEGKQVGLGA